MPASVWLQQTTVARVEWKHSIVYTADARVHLVWLVCMTCIAQPSTHIGQATAPQAVSLHQMTLHVRYIEHRATCHSVPEHGAQ